MKNTKEKQHKFSLVDFLKNETVSDKFQCEIETDWQD